MVNIEKDSHISKIKTNIRRISLNDIVKKHRIKDGALKMDAEGAEYKIIANASINTLKKFKQVQIDFHRHGSDKITNKLSKAGFKSQVTMTILAGKIKSGYISAQRN